MALIRCPECGREVSEKAPSCPNCGTPIAEAPLRYVSAPSEPAPKKKEIGCLSGGCLILIVLIVIGAIVGGNAGDSSSHSSAAPIASPLAAPSRAEEAARKVEITKWSWHKGGFDSIMFATFTFRNNNDFAVKDITVRCEHTAPSGTRIDDNTRTIYKRIAPHKKLTVHDFDMGFIHSQAERSGCQVTSVVPE